MSGQSEMEVKTIRNEKAKKLRDQGIERLSTSTLKLSN